MQTKRVTRRQVAAWKKTYQTERPKLSPNRRSGAEVTAYLEAHYPVEPFPDPVFLAVVAANILENPAAAEKLPQDAKPDIAAFRIPNVGAGATLYRRRERVFRRHDILCGIDAVTGYIHVEGSSALYDELFYFRGLDADDLGNMYLVAEYAACRSKFGTEVTPAGKDS